MVASNLREAKHLGIAADVYGVENLYRLARGPFPADDVWGMFWAVSLLNRSLEYRSET